MTSEQSNTPEADLDAALDALIAPAEGEEGVVEEAAAAEADTDTTPGVATFARASTE